MDIEEQIRIIIDTGLRYTGFVGPTMDAEITNLELQQDQLGLELAYARKSPPDKGRQLLLTDVG